MPAGNSPGLQERGLAELALALLLRPRRKLLVQLKEHKLAWSEIHRCFSAVFPKRRSQGSLQVRYCTKLKDRDGC
jgi:hypothetical protein